MATMVAEVMNREVFVVRVTDRADDTLATLLAMGLSAAPVVDDWGKAIGMISWRDLVPPGADDVGPRMTRAVETVRANDRLEIAAATLATARVHHAPVVDVAGALVGFVSALDLLCAVAGLPAPHPPLFPHFDELTGVVWSDDQPLNDARIAVAPDGPGVIVYIDGGRGRPERIVHAETTGDVRARLLDRLSEPFADVALRRAYEEGRLRYRAARITDAKRREEVVEKILRLA
jgi:CBS domain-containing protein